MNKKQWKKLLKEALKISKEDDNDDIIISTTYSSGPVDKENPRIELTINHD
jgi:hypothetical protein